jgi:acyl-CoA synthetase (NDP forming)
MLAPVPAYTFPESPIRALGRVASYASWRSTPVAVAPAFDDIDVAEVRRLVDAASAAGGGWLTPDAVPALLAAAGIAAIPTEIVGNEDAARTAAARLGYPVVLKGTGPLLLHKTESHAVITRLADEPSMLRAFHALASSADVEHVVIQPMIEGGAEMFVGATFDAAFGHLIVCGGGGTTVELLRDTAHRLAPLTQAGVGAMLDQVRSIRLLRGFVVAPCWTNQPSAR